MYDNFGFSAKKREKENFQVSEHIIYLIHGLSESTFCVLGNRALNSRSAPLYRH